MTRMKQWRYMLLAILAIIALAAFSACGDDDDDDSGGTETAAPSGQATDTGAASDMAPDADQVLKINVGAEPNTIDPQAQSYTYEATIVNNSFIRLFDQDPETSELIPFAAKEMPTVDNGGISADNLTYTITLKDGLKWSDGSPLTAQDFVYGIMRGYNLNISGAGYGGFITSLKGAEAALAFDPASATYVDDVNTALADSVVAVDDTHLKLVAEFASVSFLSNFSLPITAAVQQANVEALGETFGTAAGASEMVTSGWFTVTDWAAKDHITMTRNDNFTAGDPALLREVEVHFIEDTTQAYNAFEADQLDLVALPPSVYPQLKDDPRVIQEAEFGTRWITVDVTIPPWDKPDFVIAMNQATDRETIANDVYQGIRSPYAAFCPEKVLHCDTSIFSNLEFDLEAAKASALKAYPDGNIPGITLEIVDDPTVANLATHLKDEWEAVPGVSVTIKTTDQQTLRADMKGHISGTQITGWGMDFADPTDIFSIKNSAQIGANNLGFYDRAEYDRLEELQDTQYDDAERADTLKQLQEFYASDPADITFAVQLRTDIADSNVKGLISSPFNYQLYGDQNLALIYISK